MMISSDNDRIRKVLRALKFCQKIITLHDFSTENSYFKIVLGQNLNFYLSTDFFKNFAAHFRTN